MAMGKGVGMGKECGTANREADKKHNKYLPCVYIRV